MKRMYFNFKTLVTPEINIKSCKGRVDEYLAKSKPLVLAFAVEDEEPTTIEAPFTDEHRRELELAFSGEDFALISHSVEFHKAVWASLNWPTPKAWQCTMVNFARIHPKKPKSLKACAEFFELPERIQLDEMALGGKVTPELVECCKRDVQLIRLIERHLLAGSKLASANNEE